MVADATEPILCCLRLYTMNNGVKDLDNTVWKALGFDHSVASAFFGGEIGGKNMVARLI